MLLIIKPEYKKGFVFPSMKLRCLDMTDESLAALGDEGYCENQVLPQTQFYSVSVLQPKFIVESVGVFYKHATKVCVSSFSGVLERKSLKGLIFNSNSFLRVWGQRRGSFWKGQKRTIHTYFDEGTLFNLPSRLMNGFLQGQARGIWTYHSMKFEIWLYHEGPTLQSRITQKGL